VCNATLPSPPPPPPFQNFRTSSSGANSVHTYTHTDIGQPSFVMISNVSNRTNKRTNEQIKRTTESFQSKAFALTNNT
jgi:hypothetical protein